LRLTASITHQNVHEKCLNKSVPFGYRLKLNNTADIETADEHFFSFWTLTSMAPLAWEFTINCF
jgi:hypothetical protein